ncbi:hypothetical protein NitYY0826_C1846 [Nitratiruptor sp. YY08-26]|uniref:hypothetical protein n=1 Tax=unclassified Nitratiruptor TaxID=2624044 RepID=UPI0019168660|nr:MULTISPECIES: hypothetical protein [unclassified Nitratiruptor]BCD62958.1 hypothetical protein NitYY0813_C1844 [Nitratiruptor sp. YY08-13]BCD66893.1 hypothetical protein NitYY0826_C1846 [Nitratiruptor sp. YY08-26]
MKRVVAIIALLQMVVLGADYVKELKSYLTSRDFCINGILYTYDFDHDGYIEDNEWIYVSMRTNNKYRMLGTKPTSNNMFGFQKIDIELKNSEPRGYFTFINFQQDNDRKLSWIFLSAKTGIVYKLIGATEEHRFKYLLDKSGNSLLRDITYVIESNQVSFIYNKLDAFPYILSNFDTKGFSWSLVLGKQEIYIADGSNGVVVLNTTNENFYNPQLSIKKIYGHTYGIAEDFQHHKIYIALGKKGIKMLDSESLDEITSVKAPKKRVSFENIWLSPDKKALYALDGKGVFAIYRDLEKNSMNYCDTIVGDFADAVISDEYLYLIDRSEGVKRYSLAMSTAPKFEVAVSVEGLEDAAVIDGYVYGVYDQKEKMVVITPECKIAKNLDTPHTIFKLIADPEHKKLYALNNVASIDVFDVSNPLDPQFEKTIYLPYPAMDLKIKGSFGYIANGGNGLIVIQL